LKDQQLIEQPALDFDRFQEAQRETIETQFAGKRTKKRPPGLFLWKILDRACHPIATLQRGMTVEIRRPAKLLTEKDIEVNMGILRELRAETQQCGARFIVVDGIRHWENDAALSDRLRQTCTEFGMGYIDLSSNLSRAVDEGCALTWKHDGHFNPEGHRVFANSLYDWISRNATGESSGDVN
jgi:hypothetical protein